MNTVDLIILVFLLIGAYTGFKKGFLMEVISLSAFFIALSLGIKLLDWGIQFLDQHIEGYDHVLPIIAFVIIFLGVVLGLHFIGKLIKSILDMTLLGSLDDVAGSLLGIIKWALFVSIFLWVFMTFGGSFKEETVGTSILYEPISSIAPGIFGFFSDFFPYFMEFFEQTRDAVDQVVVDV